MKVRDNRKLDEAVEKLKYDILHGVLAPGQRLVETDLMDDLELSRTRIREALRRLEVQGLVEIHQNRGALVRRISREEVINAIEVLDLLTMHIVEKVAVQASHPGYREKLERSLAETREFRKKSRELVSVAEYMWENARFWGSLADLVDNPFLSDFRLRLQNMLFRLAIAGLNVKNNREQWLSWHEEILTAMLENKIRTATRLARKSGDDVWSAILALPDKAFSRPDH